MFQDEARFGRMAKPRRCWAPKPCQPVMLNGYEREFVYAYGAVSPCEGDFDWKICPQMNTQRMSEFLAQVSQRYREQLFPSRSLRAAYDHLVAQQGARRGAVEYLRLLKLASEVGQSDVEVMLADCLSPPFPAWSVEALRRLLQPSLRSPLELAELQPEWRSYDALLTPSQEMADAC